MKTKKRTEEFRIDQINNTLNDLLPIGLAIVDSNTRITVVNKTLNDMMSGDGIIELGKNIGDGFRCVESLFNGCGNGNECIKCQIRNNISQAIQNGNTYNNVIIKNKFKYNENVVSPFYKMNFVPIKSQGEDYVLITVDDITDIYQQDRSIE